MEQPLISIIMPTYNAGPYIAEAIESVLQQTWTHWELLILDDASTDQTASIVSHYSNDPRIRYSKLSHIGHPAGVRNVGLQQIKGEFISFLDADDQFLPEALETLAGALLSHASWHSVRGFQRWMDENGQSITGNYVLNVEQNGQFSIPEAFQPTFEKLVLSQNIVSVLPAMMMRAETFKKVGYLNESLSAIEDYEYYLRLYLHDFNGFGMIPQYIYNYRIYPNSLTQDKNRLDKNIQSGLQVMDWLFAQPKLPAACRALKGKAYGRRYQIFARYQLMNVNKQNARHLLKTGWQNANVSRLFYLKNLLPLLIRTYLPSGLNQSLVKLRWLLRYPQQMLKSS